MFKVPKCASFNIQLISVELSLAFFFLLFFSFSSFFHTYNQPHTKEWLHLLDVSHILGWNEGWYQFIHQCIMHHLTEQKERITVTKLQQTNINNPIDFCSRFSNVYFSISTTALTVYNSLFKCN